MKRAPVYLVLLTVFIDLLGFGIIIPLLPFYAKHYGATPTVIGLLSSSYSFMQFLFVPFWGRFSDRIGRRPIILMSVFGSFISYLIFGFAGSLAVLFFSRALAGFMGANISTAQAYIADTTTLEDRARFMGLIGAAFGVGFMLGPFVGGIMSKISYGAPGFLASGLSLVNFVLAYFMLPESMPETATGSVPAASGVRVTAGAQGTERSFSRRTKILNIGAMHEAFKRPAIASLVLIFFFYTISFSVLYVAFPLFTYEAFGYGASQNGYMFALIGMIGIMVQGGAIGKVTKKAGEKNTMIIGILILIASLAVLPSLQTSFELVITTAVMAVGSSLVTPPLTSLITKSAGPGEHGTVLGVSQSFSSLGRVIGPFWGGFILGAAGTAWPFYTGGLMLSAAFLLARRIPAMPVESGTSTPSVSK